MEKVVVWVALAGVYGALLAILFNVFGSWGLVPWIGLVLLAQWWLRKRAENNY